MDLPLEGVRVLEVGGGIPAAYAGRVLAGYGADVVRTHPDDIVLLSREERLEGIKGIGEALRAPSLKAMEAAIWKAMSFESTS